MTELVQKGTLPTLEQLDDAGKAVVVNQTGNNYTLGVQSGASVLINSWMSAFIDAAGAPAGAVVWSPDGDSSLIVGDDLSFSSATVVSFDTPGLYSAILDVCYLQSADADGVLRLSYTYGGDGDDAALPSFTNQAHRLPISPTTAFNPMFQLPVPLPLFASMPGYTLAVNVIAELEAGTVTLTSGFSLNIARIT